MKMFRGVVGGLRRANGWIEQFLRNPVPERSPGDAKNLRQFSATVTSFVVFLSVHRQSRLCRVVNNVNKQSYSIPIIPTPLGTDAQREIARYPHSDQTIRLVSGKFAPRSIIKLQEFPCEQLEHQFSSRWRAYIVDCKLPLRSARYLTPPILLVIKHYTAGRATPLQ